MKKILLVFLIFIAPQIIHAQGPMFCPAGQTLQQVNGAFICNGPNGATSTPIYGYAQKPFTSDAIQYVSKNGSDANDGLSRGSPKATIDSSINSLPNCNPIPSVGQSVSPTAPCGTIYLAANASGYSLSTGVIINGLLVRIIGEGKNSVTINCTAATCFTFNNQSPYAFAPSMSTDGGLYNLTLNGNGSASQLGIFCKTCDGMILHDVRISNFNGTSANGFEFLNDATGGITERNDWNNVAFDNNTNDILMTTSGTGNSTSFGHNSFRHLQFSLNNLQTAWTLGGTGTNGGATLYASYIDGVINASDSNTGHTATAISISGTAKILGNFRLIIDNGGGLTITPCSGCTNANFGVWGFGDGSVAFDASNGMLTTTAGIKMNALTSGLGTGPAWYAADAFKMQAALDGSGFLEFYNASNSPIFGISQTGIVNQPGLQIFNTTTTCTTAATVGSTCTTAAITLPVADADTSYRISCTGKGPTGVPAIVATANSSATQFTITIAALTAAAASYASYDCMAGHN